MMLTQLRLQQISPDTYATWFDQNYNYLHRRSPYHHPLWLDTVRECTNADLVFIAIYAEGALAGVLPGFLMTRGPFRLFGSPLRGTLTGHLGPAMLELCDTGSLRQIIETCSDYIRRTWRVHYADFVVAEQPPAEPGAASNNGWMHGTRASYCLDLRCGHETLWSRLTQRARRMIRKSERCGLTITSLNDAEQYYSMLNETYARRGTVPTHPPRFFRTIFAKLVPKGLVWAWGTEHNAQCIAGGLFLHDDRRVEYLSGASRTQFRAIPTSYLLHWHAISTAAHLNLQTYDFAGRGISSIDEFKGSFNPSSVDYSCYNCAAPYVRIASKVYLSYVVTLRRIQLWKRNVPLAAAPRNG